MKPDNHLPPDIGVHHKPWEHAALKTLAAGGLATAGLALAPVVLPTVIANPNVAVAGANAISFCTSGAGEGLASSAAALLSQIPIVGNYIAVGGIATAAISGGLAVGGMLWANYLDKHTRKDEFRWGSVVRWAALSTSILIALPAIIPAISMGTMFFGLLAGSTVLTEIAFSLGSLGAAGAASGMSTALGAAGLAGVHALTCALPLGAAGFFLGQKEEKPMPKLQLPALADGRVTPPLPLARAVA